MPEFKEITNDETLYWKYIYQNFDAWGAPLSIEQWVELSKGINSTIQKHDLVNRYFGLVEGDNLLAACEVLDRPFYIGNDGRISSDHVIAGVHTPSEHRRKGYAKSLIDGVVSNYINDKQGQLSLWSDVKDFYARNGFKKMPGDEFISLVLEPVQEPVPSSNQEWIDTPEKLETVRKLHNQLLKETADKLNGAVIEASPAIYEINVSKSTLYKKITGESAPEVFGARIDKSWATWSYHFGSGNLLIMGIDGTPEQVSELLKLAANMAAKLGLKRIELFETTLVDINFKQVVENVEKLQLKYHVETDRKGMQPMYIGKKPWFARGGYGWF